MTPGIRGGIEYFGSFSGYGPELCPVDPIPFEQTRLVAGYVEVEREGGQVAVLRNVRVSRSPAVISHPLGDARPPGTQLIFEAVFDPRLGEHLVGSETAYLSTRSAHGYFSGDVEGDGRTVAVRLYRRGVHSSEVYDHDATGRLVMALHFAADRLPRVELFGDDGGIRPLADHYTGTRDAGGAARIQAEGLRQRAKEKFAAADYQHAVADLEAALALVDGDVGGEAILANILCNLGTGWLYLEDYARASFFAACGFEMHARRRNIRGAGVCVVTLGAVFQSRHLSAQAAECHTQAAHLFAKSGDAESREFALRQFHANETWRSNSTVSG